MPHVDLPASFRRTPSPEDPEHLADVIADSVVDHLPAAIQEPLRKTVRKPLARRLGRALLVLALVAYFAFAALILTLRYGVLPEIGRYKPNVEQLLSESLARPVSIGTLEAHWVGLQPALRIGGLSIADAEGVTALQLEQVDATLSWDSVLFAELRLAQLEIIAPQLRLRRAADGRLFVAGLPLTPAADSDNSFAEWLLAQHRIIVRNAHIRWDDEQRQAPALELAQVNFQLDNNGRLHRFGLNAMPPAGMAARLDIRGDFTGRNPAEPATWKGESYVEIDEADLAVWQRWIDYPIEMPKGHGGLRLWLGIAKNTINRVTADVRLAELSLRLQPELELLNLEQLSGRLGLERDGENLKITLDKLSLATSEGVSLAPTNLTLKLTNNPSHQQINLTANQLDLGALSRLATYLPLAAEITGPLATYSPQGKISDLQFDWSKQTHKTAGELLGWQLNAQVDRLGLMAHGSIPGISGLSGRIAGNQSSGQITLDSHDASVNLPLIFDPGELHFDHLLANAEWSTGRHGLAVNLRRLRIENNDLAGEASGTWRPHERGEGPGIIDLSAHLERLQALGLGRYLPTVLSPGTRAWIGSSLLAGEASNTRLVLKGNLAEFPFSKPGSGTFDVRGHVAGVTLDYATDWPAITDINGEMVFAGQRMQINAQSGQVLGATLKDVKAEIPDLETAETTVNLRGQATGPTAEFLKFIEASPVGESIDHFTRDIRAEGNGALDIELHLPLEHMEKTRIAGSYRLDDNRVHIIDDLPWFSGVRGRLQFTGDDFNARNLQARLLGSPISVDLRSAENLLHVSAKGEFDPALMRSEMPLPLLDHLAGSTRWNANLRVGKRGTEISLSSNLLGLSSSLPEPFNKPATESRPLRFERKPLLAPVATAKAPVRAAAKVGAGGTAPAPAIPLETIELSVANALRVHVQRRLDGDLPLITRGTLTVSKTAGSAPERELPERQLAVFAELPLFDIDFWRVAWRMDSDQAAAAPALPVLPPLRFDLRTEHLRLFDRNFGEMRFSGEHNGMLTKTEVRGPAFAASINFDSTGKGRLSGVIPNLAIPESAREMQLVEQVKARSREIVTQLPAIELKIDQISYKGRDFGKLTINAENRSDGVPRWDAQLALRNTEASFNATIAWQPEAPQLQTQVAFDLDTRSIEKTLNRLGYADTVRRGNAAVQGTLAWASSPVDIDYPTLTGGFHLEAAKGQFNKLEPGVGRLLGVLSLQSLPRRITLDFRDVFSEGFAFDDISGDFVVRQGIMDTDALEVSGTSAKVLMRGQIDLAQETQNLHVRVKPAVGESIAVGAMLAANPVTGVIAWAAQKLLRDPLDQVFSFDYAVTGGWADPKVDKVGSNGEIKK